MGGHNGVQDFGLESGTIPIGTEPGTVAGTTYFIQVYIRRYRKSDSRLSGWRCGRSLQPLVVGCSMVGLPSLGWPPGWDMYPGVHTGHVIVAVFQWMLTQMMGVVLSEVLTQARQEKDNFLDSGFLHHNEHRAIK